MADRLDFEIDVELETGLITGDVGVPGLIEAFRQTGTAAVIACDKRAAKWAYDGNRGYQPVLALWAEHDVILADEFRDGNSLPSGLTRWVPAGSGNRRVVEKALARPYPAVSTRSIGAATARSTSTS